MNLFSPGQLLFHFGKMANPSNGLAVACLNGGIMADTGSEAKEYVFVCQDRYPLYAAMGGMRCLLFIRNEAHTDQYIQRIKEVKHSLATINRFTQGVMDVVLPTPLFVPCSLNKQNNQDNMRYLLAPDKKFADQFNDPVIMNLHLSGGIYLNQISPTIYDLLRQLYTFLQDQGIEIKAFIDEYGRIAKVALKWHNKANYVLLSKEFIHDPWFPAHVPTGLISSTMLKDLTWEKLVSFFQKETNLRHVGEYYIKSGMDAAGEVSVILNQQSFGEKIKELENGVRLKVSQMERSQKSVDLLVQTRIKRAGMENGFPASVGLTYQIKGKELFELLVVIGHVYEDAECKTFIGSYYSDSLTQHVLSTIGEKKIKRLLSMFADQGYRGPINLDAVCNDKGGYVFIYDCNPRMGGALPGLLVKEFFQQRGHGIYSLFTLGCQGRIAYPDLEAKLLELSQKGLLYTGQNQAGLCIIPSLVRFQSFDVVMVNLEMEQILKIIDSDLVHTLSNREQSNLKGVYL